MRELPGSCCLTEDRSCHSQLSRPRQRAVSLVDFGSAPGRKCAEGKELEIGPEAPQGPGAAQRAREPKGKSGSACVGSVSAIHGIFTERQELCEDCELVAPES